MDQQDSLGEYASHTAKAVASLDGSLIGNDVDFTLEQVITEDGAIVGHYHLVLAAGTAAVHPGPAESADITIKQDAETARAIRNGTLHAQGAFLKGRLAVDGDITKLLEHGPLLGELLAAEPNH